MAEEVKIINDQAALSETLLPDKGQLTEIGGGQPFLELELALPSEPTM